MKTVLPFMLLLIVLAGCDKRNRDEDVYVTPPPTISEVVPDAQPAVRGESPLNLDCDNRALVVGIANYGDASNLSSPVLMAGMQKQLFLDRGFKPENIRVLLDHQATAPAIRDGLTWLLADEKPGDVRAWYQSSHGAQWSGGNEGDGIDEILYVYGSSSWQRDAFITDDELFERFSKTAQTCMHYVRLDLCYSGGFTKMLPEPGKPAAASKQITPPDHIQALIARAKPKQVRLKVADLTNVCYEYASQENETSLAIGSGLDAYDLFTKNRIKLDYQFPNRFVETNMKACYALMVADGFRQQHPSWEGNTKTIYLAPNLKVKRAPKKTENDVLLPSYMLPKKEAS